MSEKDTIKDNKNKSLDLQNEVSNQKQAKKERAEEENALTDGEKQTIDTKIESKNEVSKDSETSKSVDEDKNLDVKDSKSKTTLTTTPSKNNQKSCKTDQTPQWGRGRARAARAPQCVIFLFF